MAKWFVYRSDLGSPDARPIVRWGEAPAADIALQASEPGEVAVASDSFAPLVAGEGGIGPAALCRNSYDPATGGFGGAVVREADHAALAVQARATCAALLAACDWTQLPDVPLTRAERAGWAAYRQALRDLPQQAGFPDSPTWPTRPA